MVKCRLCGKKIDKKDAFQSPDGGGRFYYCNEEEARLREEQKREKIEKQAKAKEENKKKKIDPIYEEASNIFGYRIQNTSFFKEEKIWREITSDENILGYLQENRDYITNAIRRLDSSEFAKIRYFSAILKNSLKDFSTRSNVKSIETNDVDVSDFNLFAPVGNRKQKRRSFAELEE